MNISKATTAILVSAIAGFAVATIHGAAQPLSRPATQTASITAPAVSSSQQYPELPNPVLTPGAARTTDLSEIRSVRTGTVRDVPESVKKAVFAEYGIPWDQRSHYEVDHLIPLTIGGDNTSDPSKPNYLHNLWAEYEGGKWNYHVKDRLEAHLGALVKAGTVPVDQAQRDIATNWITAYGKYMPEAPGSVFITSPGGDVRNPPR